MSIAVNGRGRMAAAVREMLEPDAGPVTAVIDFSSPASCIRQLHECVYNGWPLVCGTTGLPDLDLAYLKACKVKIPIVLSGNFSLGVNVLLGLVRRAAATLPDDWDVHVAEAHHKHKKDSPSGTALMLAEAALGRNAGFAVTRAGEIVGEHSVTFAGPEEIITLSHSARDRALFARGALVAARWIIGKPPGLYSMQDVLGLNDRGT